MARKIDNENSELENYGTWVKKDLLNQNNKEISDIATDDLDLSDLDFENEDDLALDDDFLNEIDSFDMDDNIDSDDFDLSEIHDIDDDLISPEEESELIMMAEDDWEPEDDQHSWDDDSFEETPFLSEDDMNASGDFMSDENSSKLTAASPSSSFGEDGLSISMVEKQTRLLEKIENELSVIKDEILDIRSQLVFNDRTEKDDTESGVQKETVQSAETKGFFDEDDDESIVLTGDELDNIINTAEITAEEGSNNAPESDGISDEDPGLSILSTPESDDEISLDMEELSLDEEEELSPP